MFLWTVLIAVLSGTLNWQYYLFFVKENVCFRKKLMFLNAGLPRRLPGFHSLLSNLLKVPPSYRFVCTFQVPVPTDFSLWKCLSGIYEHCSPTHTSCPSNPQHWIPGISNSVKCFKTWQEEEQQTEQLEKALLLINYLHFLVCLLIQTKKFQKRPF